MGINHGGVHILVPQEFLDGSDVVPAFEQMGRKRMPKGVAGNSFRDPGAKNGFPDGFLEYRFIQMAAVKAPVGGVRKLPVSREHPLPAPLPLRPWVFPCDRSRKFNISPSVPEIFFMLRPDVFEVSLQIVQ
jgi:hypothetical protein